MEINFFFYMFYNNMYETSSKLNEILLLNKQLRNYLSMKGGTRQDLYNFKDKLNNHKYYIFYLFCLCFTTIIYLCVHMVPQNKKFIGGNNTFGDDAKEKIGDVTESISNYFTDLFEKINDNISDKYGELSDGIGDNIEEVIDPIIDGINSSIESGKSVISNLLWTSPIGFFPPIVPFIIIVLLITYGCCNYILDRKLYLPCWGCQDGNIAFKCMPGTGKDSISCTIYSEFLNTIKMILKQFKFIKDFINIIRDAIKKAIDSILFIVDNITDWVTDAFSQSIGKIFDALKFLKHINVPDDWGFNFGEFLICTNSSLKGDDCIYHKNGKIRIKHGKGALLEAFWKIIRVILEVPPSIPKFPFGGGMKLKVTDIKETPIVDPTIEKHNIKTKTKSHSKKPVPIINDKKDIIYENLLKVLIKIDINPIKWLAALFNLLVDAINIVMDGILLILKEIMTFIFSIITEAAKGLTEAMGKIFNQLLVPINEVVSIALKLPKILYKTIKDIFDVGFFAIVSYYFHSMITNIFPFLKYIKSFIIVITLVVIIMSILTICPMIGAYYAFFKPYDYIKTTTEGLIDQVKYTFKNSPTFTKYIEDLIVSLEFSKELNKQLGNMEKGYKYVIGIIIIIIILFIIMNMFTNVNRKILLFIRSIIYNNYGEKYKNIRKKYASFKLNKIITESNEMKGITKNYATIMKIKKEENEKDLKKKINDENTFSILNRIDSIKKEGNENTFSILNRIDSIKNLGINQLKSFT